MVSREQRVDRLEKAVVDQAEDMGPEPTPEEVEQARQILAEVGLPEALELLPEMDPAQVEAWLYESGPLPGPKR